MNTQQNLKKKKKGTYIKIYTTQLKMRVMKSYVYSTFLYGVETRACTFFFFLKKMKVMKCEHTDKQDKFHGQK